VHSPICLQPPPPSAKIVAEKIATGILRARKKERSKREREREREKKKEGGGGQEKLMFARRSEDSFPLACYSAQKGILKVGP
jgi:hypothetical protein